MLSIFRPGQECWRRGVDTLEDARKLADVVDLAYLQRLQDTFADVAGITTVVIGPDGLPLTRPSNLHGFCSLMQGNAAGVQRCMCTNTLLCEENRRTGGPATLVCPHSGLTTGAVPIFLEGEHLGSWIIGQARVRDPEARVLAETARQTGIGQERLQQALDGLPRTTEAEFERVFGFLQELSETVVRLSQVGNEMAKSNVELRLITAQYENTSAMLRKFVDASDVGMYVSDLETGELLMANKRFADGAGLDEAELLGRKCWQVAGPPGSSGFCAYCPRKKLLDEDGRPTPPLVWENHLPHLNIWLRVTSQAVHWVDGRLVHMVTYLDITAERIMRDELAKLAFYDSHTDLPNGLKLQRDLKEGSGDGRYLVCFDVGALRRVNAAYNRATGDVLLHTIVLWVLRQGFGHSALYRIGGDEFVLYFQTGTDETALAAAQAILERFGRAWRLNPGGQQVTVLCRVSVAAINLRSGTERTEVLTLVERMLAESKAQGGIVLYNEEMDRASREHLRLEMSLKNCVQNGMQGFDVHFQPIVEPAAGTWKGLEALCRWTDPETGAAVQPAVFIKEAEQLGLIREIGMFVLERAVGRCKEWRLDEVPGFFVSVNLSPDQVMDEQFADRVTGILRAHGYPGENLALEVTESTEFTFNAYSIKVIDSLRFRGVRFFLDDFGTGYSSFNNLKNLPVSVLKTEHGFIDGIEDDEYMQYFFYSMAELAHAADMRLIAEGVETAAQLAIILKNGADYVQGFYFSEPLPAARVAENLAKFTQVDPGFYRLNNTRLTQNIFSGKDAYLISPKLFRLLNESMQALLRQVDMDKGFDEVLALVGRHFEVARAYVFLRQEGDGYVGTHEWRAPGAPSLKDALGAGDIRTVSPNWLPALLEDRMIVASNVTLLPGDIRAVLEAQHIRAVAVLPMLDGEELIGFVGFDDSRFREWLPEEIALLGNLCMVMAGTLKRQRLQQQLYQTDLRFSDVLNSMNLGVVVTDPKTHDILWKNKAIKELYALPEVPVGHKCYQVLHGLQQPCEFCKVPRLLQSRYPKRVSWEYYNKRTNRYFMVTDSLVRWGGQRKMHLQYAVDITDIKAAQRKLERFATTDSLTDTKNRNTLITALRAHLREAADTGKPLSVAFIDIDKLKFANDTHGHSFGDELILRTVHALREVMGPRDLIGRYGGDEFVVLLPEKTANEAQRLMEAARGAVGDAQDSLFEGFSFSYGIVESGELPFDDSERVLNAVVNLADDRMRDYKKKERGHRAQSQAQLLMQAHGKVNNFAGMAAALTEEALSGAGGPPPDGENGAG